MPDWKPEIRRRLAGLHLAPTREAAIVEELAQYLDDHYAESLAGAASEAEAYQQTLSELSGSELLARELRRMERPSNPEPIVCGTNRRTNMVADLWQDMRYGIRTLLKNPVMTAFAALSLALGIGANTAIFSLIDAVLLKTLPVERPEQLYFIQNVGTGRPDGGAPPYPCFERFRDQGRSFAGMAAFGGMDPRLKIDGQIEEVRGQRVSGNYFSLLGVKAVLGRTFRPADDSVPGNGGPDGLVAVISYNYWTRRFGRDPAVIGKVVRLGEDPVTIIGVTQPEFYGLVPGKEVDISLPIMVAGAEMLTEKTSWWFDTVGRLKPGVPVEHARAELDTIFQSYMDETKFNAEARRDSFTRIDLRPAGKGLNDLRRQFSQPLQALMGVVAMVLLIACANVANLLLAGAVARRKEFAVRLALGASRFRLMRQTLTESLLLVFLGGLIGLLFARWGGAFLVSFFATGRDQLFIDLRLDYRVLSFTAGVASLTGLIFGLAPALQVTRVDPNHALKDCGATITRSRSHFGKSLVAMQVAISLLLLVGAGLFARTLRNLKNIDAGFQADGVLTMRVNPAWTIQNEGQGERLANLWKEVMARVERLPGVRHVSLCALSPLDGGDRAVGVEVSGFTPRERRDNVIRMNQVTPGYFRTFGIAVLEGRGFTDADNERAPGVALFNEAAARFYFGDRSPLGAQIRFFHDPREKEPPPYEIVGVVKDSRYQNLREPDTRLIYLPVAQKRDRPEELTLAVRAEGEPTGLIVAVSSEVRSAGSDILLTHIATLNEQIDQSLVQERLVATLSLFFGLLALLLACIGLYGVMSYDVARRTYELGVRMALGAQRSDVIGMVLRESMLLVVIGALIGLGAALAATRLISSLLYGLSPTDPLTIGLAALLMLAVAALACYLPARRASQVDPMAALRME
jgi:predicted permease